jgi:predicted HicB family RNase H-like nuclease
MEKVQVLKSSFEYMDEIDRLRKEVAILEDAVAFRDKEIAMLRSKLEKSQ